MQTIFKTVRKSKPIVFALVFAILILAMATPSAVAANKSPGVIQAGWLNSLSNKSLSGHRISKLSAADSTVLGPVQTATIYADDAKPLDEFGYAVAMDGNIAVIGARNKSIRQGDDLLTNAGVVYVFSREGNYWEQKAQLVAKDAEAGDSFGTSVAISGNTIVVGATGVEIDDENDAGAAYVFTGSGSTWTQRGKLYASDAIEEDNFGSSVAIERYTIVVGANTKFEYPNPNVGAAYVFKSSGGKAWAQQAKLVASDAQMGDFYGTSVALYRNTIVVGATQANPGGVRGEGKVYIFSRNGTKWNERDTLQAEGGRTGDFFGHSVAMSGDRIVVGALFADPAPEDWPIMNAGAAYVFVRKGNGWKQDAELVARNAQSFDEFGTSVSVSGNTIIVGAPGKTYYGHLRAGAAYLFTRGGAGWEQQSMMAPQDPYKYDETGQSVWINGDQTIIGAPGRDPENIALAGESFVSRLGQVALPDTGFAPGKTTALPIQPRQNSYQGYGDLWLEIPALKARVSIVGVPRGGNGWDVRWLADQAGYLADTAFPTWKGYTGLAGHAVLPNGKAGPFADLESLVWGEKVIIHAWGQRYIYEVRGNTRVTPNDLSVLGHKDLDWVTLITCQDYDESRANYQWRRVVQAVLVKVEPE